MVRDGNNSMTEVSDSGFPIEIYTEERIEEFLAEDKMTPEQRKRLEEKLKESNTLKSSSERESL